MASIVYSSRNKPISALLVTTAIIVTRTTFISSSTVSGGHTGRRFTPWLLHRICADRDVISSTKGTDLVSGVIDFDLTHHFSFRADDSAASTHGRKRTLAIGVYPAIGLTAARAARDEAKRNLSADIDPSVVKQERKRAAKIATDNTFEAIPREWHENR